MKIDKGTQFLSVSRIQAVIKGLLLVRLKEKGKLTGEFVPAEKGIEIDGTADGTIYNVEIDQAKSRHVENMYHAYNQKQAPCM